MECWSNGVLEKAALSDAANPLLLIKISLYCSVQSTYHSEFASLHYSNTPLLQLMNSSRFFVN